MSEAQSPNKALTLTVTCIGSFMLLLDTSIVTLALPRIQTDLHASLADLQWTVDAYILPFAVLMLTAGTLGDRFGRKRLLLSGLVLFVLGSLCSGLAPTLGWLLCGRAIQGLGASALSTGSLSVLVAAFSEHRARTQAIGLWSGVSNIALAAGPLVGGLLVQVWSWPAIFLINIPIGIVAFCIAWPGLSESRNPHARSIDLPGQVLVIAGLACLVVALIEASALGWSSPVILGLFAGAIILLGAFLVVETRVSEPLLPLILFRSRAFSIANVVGFIAGLTALSTIFFIAQYFQEVQGASVLVAGLRTLPISMGAFIMAPIAGTIAGRIGTRVPMTIGLLLCGGAIFLLTRVLEPTTSYVSLWWILALMGLGLGLTLSPATASVFTATPPNRTGLGSSMFTTSNEIGNTLGIAVIGALVLQQFTSNIVTQLTQRGISAATSTQVAQAAAASGAQANHASLPVQLPLAASSLQQAFNQAFVDALHSSFLVSSVLLIAAALLVGLVFKQDQIVVPTEQAEEVPGPLGTPVVAAVEVQER